jgi:hypothetical protein
MEYTTPPSYGSTVVNVGGIATDGKILCAGSSNSAKHSEIKGDPENSWPEPGAVAFSWNGTDANGQAVEALVEGSLGTRLDRVDVMAEVPKFVKQIVAGAAGTKPYIYQVRLLVISRSEQSLIDNLVRSQAPHQDQDWRRGEDRGGYPLHRGHLHFMSVNSTTCIYQSPNAYWSFWDGSGVFLFGFNIIVIAALGEVYVYTTQHSTETQNARLCADDQILIMHNQFTSITGRSCCRDTNFALCILGQGIPPSNFSHGMTLAIIAEQIHP